jgi:hypothetical protein
VRWENDTKDGNDGGRGWGWLGTGREGQRWERGVGAKTEAEEIRSKKRGAKGKRAKEKRAKEKGAKEKGAKEKGAKEKGATERGAK